MSNTYSFRAELPGDVGRFEQFATADGYELTWVKATPLELDVQKRGTSWMGDLKVEFTSDATLEQLQATLRKVEDGHIMLQTLRPLPLEENTLDRNMSQE